MTVIESLKQRTKQERYDRELFLVIEKLNIVLKQKINIEHIIPEKPLSILTNFLEIQDNIPEDIIDHISMVGSSEAIYEHPQIANIMDLICIKPLLIHLLESQNNLSQLKITISDKEKQIFRTELDSKVDFKQVLQSLLSSILGIENIVLETLNHVVPVPDDDSQSNFFNTEFYYECEYFASIVDGFRDYLAKCDIADGRFTTHLLTYHWLVKQLNYHLISQIDSFAIQGNVLLPSININLGIEKELIGNKWSAQRFCDGFVNINLNYEVFLRTLYCQTKTTKFKAIGASPKQIRNQKLLYRIEAQTDWTAKLRVLNDLDKLKFEAFFVSTAHQNEIYPTALNYFLKNYSDANFEDSIINNQKYIVEAISAIEFSQNIQTYKELCQILSIPCIESIEPSVVALIKEQLLKLKSDNNVEFSNGEDADQAELIRIRTEMQYLEINKELKLLIDDLPEFIILSNRDKQDLFKNELFNDRDRKYFLQIIQILVNTKANGKDNSLLKYLTLRNCLSNPAEYDLPPKKAVPLNKIERYPGRNKIPPTHVRIRVNQKGRIIIAHDTNLDKILIIATDDHDFLK
jgi:hypothetical protein